MNTHRGHHLTGEVWLLRRNSSRLSIIALFISSVVLSIVASTITIRTTSAFVKLPNLEDFIHTMYLPHKKDWIAHASPFQGRQMYKDVTQTPPFADSSSFLETDEAKDGSCTSTFDRASLPFEERSLLVFTAPPRLDSLPDSMANWNTKLRGRGRYIVFTNDPGTIQVCKEHDIPVLCVQLTDEGLPLVDEMFKAMERVQPNGVVAFVNSDIEIFDCTPLHRLTIDLNSKHLEVRKPVHVHGEFESTGKMSEYWFAAVTRWDMLRNGTTTRHPGGGFDLWAWNLNPDGISLLPFDVPPFRFPLAMYDNWLLDVVNQVGQRNVIDASNVVPIYHRQHKNSSDDWYERTRKGTTGVYVNRYLGYNEPRLSVEKGVEDLRLYLNVSHRWKFGTTNEAPYYFKEMTNSTFTLHTRKHWSDLPEDFLNASCTDKNVSVNSCERAHWIENKTVFQQGAAHILPYSGQEDDDKHFRSELSQYERSASQHWRYTMTEQLKHHARDDGFVLLTAISYGFREHLLNFRCNLARVGMDKHFVIAALDKDVYRWGILRGLPIFLAGHSVAPVHRYHVEYGDQDFNVVTKLKSRVVLEVLKRGFSVVWSDVDITWFTHPFDSLGKYMNNFSGIAIQSNAPYVSNPLAESRPHRTVDQVRTDNPTARRRLNSGLYVAPHNELVVAAFEEIVAYAMTRPEDSEQPCFDHVLCARSPSERGNASCTYRPGNTMPDSAVSSPEMAVVALSRFSFPNGAVLVGKSNRNAYTIGKAAFEEETGELLHASHNNWVMGGHEKKRRQIDRGWWFINKEGFCIFRENKEYF